MKRFFQNIGLCSVSLMLVYALIEFGLFKWMLPLLPVKHRHAVDEPLKVMTQASKKGVIPRDYVLILGDSYALGNGDWLLSMKKDGVRPPYQATHLLHEATGRDVVNFGMPGAGSLNGYVRMLSSNWKFLNHTWLYRIGPPKTVLLYFYEGNDLEDNIHWFEFYYQLLKKNAGEEGGRILKTKDAIYPFMIRSEEQMKWDYQEELERRPWLGNLFFLRFITRVVIFEAESLWEKIRGAGGGPSPAELGIANPGKPGVDNRILSGGAMIRTSQTFFGPGDALNEVQTGIALKIYEESLKYVKEFFDEAEIKVIYIPGPASTYDFDAGRVWIDTLGEYKEYTQEQARRKSDETAAAVRFITRRLDVGFIDARPALREAARGGLLHGPLDYNHLNRRGYTVLAEVLRAALGST